jgi:hypothetical protein
VEIGIAFELFEGAKFSDGALKAIDEAKKEIFQADWKKVFSKKAIGDSIDGICGVTRK